MTAEAPKDLSILMADLMQQIQNLQQQDKNMLMLADLCVQNCFQECSPDQYMSRCIELADNIPQYHDLMINHIKTHTSQIGSQILRMLINHKLPRLKQVIIDRRKEIYLAIMRGPVSHYKYLDRVYDFCCLGIPIDQDMVMEINGTKYSMDQYFYHRIVTEVYGSSPNDPDFQALIKSKEYARECHEISTMLTNLCKK